MIRQRDGAREGSQAGERPELGDLGGESGLAIIGQELVRVQGEVKGRQEDVRRAGDQLLGVPADRFGVCQGPEVLRDAQNVKILKYLEVLENSIVL